MSFALYSFDPSTLMIDGYIHHGRYESEHECNDTAFAQNYAYYRIEQLFSYGSCLVFETPWGEQ